MTKPFLAGLGLLMLAAGPAAAQDAYMSPMDFSTQSQALTSSVIDGLSVEETARGERRGRSARASTPRQRAARTSAATPRASDARLPFVSTPTSRKRAVDAYLAGVARSSPKEAAAITAGFQGRDVTGEMQAAMRKPGLDVNDTADIMATFLAIGWETITGGDATQAQMKGLRRQVAGNLLVNPAMKNPDTRTRVGEELKVSAFAVGTSAAAAKRDGRLESFRRGIAQFYRQQTGLDLARLRMTPAGLVP